MFFWKKGKEKLTSAKTPPGLSSSLTKNLRHFKDNVFFSDATIRYREFKTKDPYSLDCALIYADNMAKPEFLSDYVVRPLISTSVPKNLKNQCLIDYLSTRVVTAEGVKTQENFEKLTEDILGGFGVVLIEGCTIALVVEAKGFPKRSVSEPVSESVVRGPRQAFVEESGSNISLIRRKLKTPNLKTQELQIGLETRTSVTVVYIEGIVRPDLVEEVLKRLSDIFIDGILDSGYIEELIRDADWSPFPTIGATERPDIVAARLLEGRVAIVVDGSPFVLTVPFFLVEAFQANEDYYENWVAASFTRILRYTCFLIAAGLPALYISIITYHPQLLPTELVLTIAAARANVPFPSLIETTGMLLLFEILREGGVRLPQPVGQAISIVGAIVLGDAAVSANLVSAPMIIIVGVTVVAEFVIPHLHNPILFIRLSLLLAASVLGLYGLLFGLIAWLLQLVSMETFGFSYMTNLSEFSGQRVKDTIIRAPWWRMIRRPRILGVKDPVRSRSRRP